MKRMWPCVVVLAGCHPALGAPPGSTPGVREMTFPVSASSLIDIRGRDGKLTVRGTDTEEARVSVRLVGDCGDTFRLAARDGAELRFEMAPSTKGQCREDWTVYLPAGVGITAHLDDADVDIEDVHGAITLQIGHGTVGLTRVDGDLQATVANGDIAASGTASWAVARLSADVGRVSLVVRGREVPHMREPGPGDWIEVPGDGTRSVRLKTTVGNVSLRR